MSLVIASAVDLASAVDTSALHTASTVATGVLPAATDNPRADFSDTPVWLSLVKALLIFVYLLISVLIVIWFERRVIGRMQQRPGPNRNGPFGLLQSLADGMKSMLKEDVQPKNADGFIFTLAPIITASMAFISFSIIPFGVGQVSMFGHRTPLQLTDTPVAVLLVLAVAGIGIYGIVLAGWSSGSTYPLLGGLRASAQMISYEIAMGLSLVAVFLYSQSMSTSQIVGSQRELWHVITLLPSFIVYVITMVGETNRLPFDLAEGEGEIVGGYFTEYSGMRFAMFFLGEYINMFTVAGLATTMFLGGPLAPFFIAEINGGQFDRGWWGVLWFTLKLWLVMYCFVWLRGTLPRTRYDQFMKFGWKFLIPATLVWVIVVFLLRASRNGWLGDTAVAGINVWTIVVLVVVLVAALALVFWWDNGQAAKEAEAYEPPPREVDPFAGGHPVPPMPGQTLKEPALVGGPALPAAEPVQGETRGATAATPRQAGDPSAIPTVHHPGTVSADADDDQADTAEPTEPSTKEDERG